MISKSSLRATNILAHDCCFAHMSLRNIHRRPFRGPVGAGILQPSAGEKSAGCYGGLWGSHPSNQRVGFEYAPFFGRGAA